MKLKERAGTYKGSTKVNVAIANMTVNIEIKIHEDGTIKASFSSTFKKGNTTLYLDPDLQSSNISLNISEMNIIAVFNENKSINLTLPGTINGFRVLQTNITLRRC